jgi:hypothetical protein
MLCKERRIPPYPHSRFIRAPSVPRSPRKLLAVVVRRLVAALKGVASGESKPGGSGGFYGRQGSLVRNLDLVRREFETPRTRGEEALCVSALVLLLSS